MSRSAPKFWWPSGDKPAGLGQRLIKAALYVPSFVYGRAAAGRMLSPGQEGPIPVMCVGNFVAGGAGKTPTALALYDQLSSIGHTPAFVSRGYGGSRERGGGFAVDADKHTASEVGDEPLLLARRGPTFVGSDRLTSLKKAAEQGASCAIFDDGFQNPLVRKDMSILVVDGAVGVGNGLCHPGGPLRAPLDAQMAQTDVVIIIGNSSATGKQTGAGPVVRRAARRGIAVLRAGLALEVPDHLRARQIVAFCGIGRPDKFFDGLAGEGLDVVQRVAFADHHTFSEREAETLIAQALANDAMLVTTQKDAARLSGRSGALNDLANIATAVPVRLAFEDERYWTSLLRQNVAAWRARD